MPRPVARAKLFHGITFQHEVDSEGMSRLVTIAIHRLWNVPMIAQDQASLDQNLQFAINVHRACLWSIIPNGKSSIGSIIFHRNRCINWVEGRRKVFVRRFKYLSFDQVHTIGIGKELVWHVREFRLPYRENLVAFILQIVNLWNNYALMDLRVAFD